jgi:hypothetical protein
MHYLHFKNSCLAFFSEQLRCKNFQLFTWTRSPDGLWKNPLWRVFVKSSWFIRNSDYTPTCKVLVDERIILKHPTHKLHITHIPVPNGLIELTTRKHKSHIRHFTHIPFPDRLVVLTVIKHIMHSRHPTDIPIPNGLIELAILKHITHACHLADIPIPNGLIELTILKHPVHCCHLTHFPVPDGVVK